MGKRILVTGGAGFIGSNIVRGLLGKGYDVVVLDNFMTGRRENIKDILDDIELLEGDIRDNPTCMNACSKVDAVLHQAALPSVPRSVADPLLTNEVNITGTLNLLLAVRDKGIENFIFASSSSIYGDTEILPKVETMKPSPLSPYALQKLTAEYYVRLFAELYGLRSLSMRYFNVFGPRQDPKSPYAAVIPLFIRAARDGSQVTIYGDGEQSRDFTFVDNVVMANILALETKRLDGQVVNIACGKRYTLNDTLRILEDISSRSIPRKYENPRLGDVKHSQADISRANEVIGYTSTVGFEEGLKSTFNYFHSQEFPYNITEP